MLTHARPVMWMIVTMGMQLETGNEVAVLLENRRTSQTVNVHGKSRRLNEFAAEKQDMRTSIPRQNPREGSGYTIHQALSTRQGHMRRHRRL